MKQTIFVILAIASVIGTLPAMYYTAVFVDSNVGMYWATLAGAAMLILAGLFTYLAEKEMVK